MTNVIKRWFAQAIPTLHNDSTELAERMREHERITIEKLERGDIDRVAKFISDVLIYCENRPMTNTKIADDALNTFCNDLFNVCADHERLIKSISSQHR